MACKFLERDQVPEPPHRVLNGVVDKGLQRWRFKNSLLQAYFLYVGDPIPEGVFPWKEMWSIEDGRR
jgi:hypothetical protein